MPRARWAEQEPEDLARDLARLDPEGLARVLRRAADRIKAERPDLPNDVWSRLNGAARAAHFGSDRARGIERAAGTVVRYLPHGTAPGPGEAVQPLAGHHGAHASLAVRR